MAGGGAGQVVRSTHQGGPGDHAEITGGQPAGRAFTLAHRSALRLLAWTMPGQRHQRRQSIVERRSPHQEPRRDPVSHGGLFPVSRTGPDWGLPAPDESQVRPRRRYDCDSPQDRDHFLHHGQESGGIPCLALGKTRRIAREAARRETPSTNKPPSAATNSYLWRPPPNPTDQQLPYEFLGSEKLPYSAAWSRILSFGR
jgi:hypothetical protein